MPAPRAAVTVLLMCALLGASAHADEPRKPAPEDPDPSFLEFLGSVDGLAESNPDYLAQADMPRPSTPARVPVKTPPPPPPPATPGVKNND